MCPGKQVKVLSIGSLTWMPHYEIINNYSRIIPVFLDFLEKIYHFLDPRKYFLKKGE